METSRPSAPAQARHPRRRRWPWLGVPAAVAVAVAMLVPPARAGSGLPVTSGPTGLTPVAGAFCSGPSAPQTALAPRGVLWDGQGGFWVSVSDSVHAEVCHVDAAGHPTLAAGDGTPGYLPPPLGDDVAATGAELYGPAGLAVAGGDLYIADSWNGRVRRVDQAGIITSQATGLRRPTSVAPDGAGGLYIADSLANQVLHQDRFGVVTLFAGSGLGAYGGDGGPAAAAGLNRPTAVAVGPGGVVYVADTNDNRIRAVNRSGIIYTVAGRGATGYTGDGGPAAAATLDAPAGMAFDGHQDLYFADSGNAVVREVTPDGRIHTVVGNGTRGSAGDGGPAGAAELTWPVDVSSDPAGALLIADSGAARVREVIDGQISTVAGNGTLGLSGDGGPAADAPLSEPLGVATGPGGVYIADSWDRAVRLVAPDGTITTLSGAFTFPVAVAVDGVGDVYVADYANRVLEIPASGGAPRVVAGTGAAGYSGDGGPATAATLRFPSGLALDGAGDLFIADSGNNVIRQVDRSGRISTYAGTGHRTDTLHPLGDGGPARLATFSNPQGLFVNGSGALLVADRNNQRIRTVAPDGTVRTLAGSGHIGWTPDGTSAADAAFNFPAGVALDTMGDVLVADAGNCVVRSIDAQTAAVSTVAGLPPARNGSPTCGYAGAEATRILFDPTAVALGPQGTVYVADSLNDRVRSFVP